MNRLLGIVIVGLWLIALATLVTRDIMPYWQTYEPPPSAAPDGDSQVGIFDAHDRRIGTSWVSIHNADELSTWHSLTALSLGNLSIPGLSSFPPVLFDTTLTFQREGRLMSFKTIVLGLPEKKIEIEGNLLGIDYSCIARFGSAQQQFSLDARFSRGLADSLRPFTHLPDLYVGQRWQMRVLDPLSLLRQSPDFKPMLVEVTGIDVLPIDGREVECFRVESHGGTAVAWVDRKGKVRIQTVHLPIPEGKITIRDEPFDEAARREARYGERDRRKERRDPPPHER